MALSDRQESLVSYWRALQPQERGVVFIALWLNALMDTVISIAQLLLLFRALLRGRRDHDFAHAVRQLVGSPSVATVLTASAVHRLGRDLWLRQQNRDFATRRQNQDRD